jgi:hypothetical protein
MSVLVVGKFQGDTAKFRQSLTDRADEFEKFADLSKVSGAIHHRFGIGDGFVMVIDEWESIEHFDKFFSNPELQAFIGEIGADPAPPEMTVLDAVSSPDQY